MDYLEEDLPFFCKVSPTACLGGRTPRALCSCCGGSVGIRRALNRPNNSKPKRKDKRC
jgi:hypothetical protein